MSNIEHKTNDDQAVSCLTVRDYFATQALAGVLASDYFLSGLRRVADEEGAKRICPLAAKVAYELADAMLAERAKSEGQ